MCSDVSIKGFWEHCDIWLNCDFVLLYSSIPHSVAIAALKFHLDKYSLYSNDLKKHMNQVAIHLMTHNYFPFNNVFYLQTRGVSMGPHYSPSLANLCQGWRSLMFFSTQNPFKSKVQWYGRYIDPANLVICICSTRVNKLHQHFQFVVQFFIS